MQRTQLSKADAQVLAQVFDPESASAKAEILIDPSLPQDRHITEGGVLAQLKAKEREAIALIEKCERSHHTSHAKHEVYITAMRILDNLVETYPNYASARNNRAQLRRWRYGDRNTLCQRSDQFDSERAAAGVAAVDDLKKAVELALPQRPNDAVSSGQGKLLAQSYTQLGALYYAAFKDLDSTSIIEVAGSSHRGWNRDRFEDAASQMFYLGGIYGSEVAKALAVHTNPHAKLCGNIVKEAMRKEVAGMLG